MTIYPISDNGTSKLRNKARILLRTIKVKQKGGLVTCSMCGDVGARRTCRNKYFDYCKNKIHEARYFSRAYCQQVNFPTINEIEPIGSTITLPTMNVKDRLVEEMKKDNKVSNPKKEKKMPVNEKASALLSKAKDAKEILKIMRSRKDIDQSRIQNLSKQVKEGTANFGRVKMTSLNLLRGALSRKNGGSPAKAKPAAKTPTKQTKAKATAPKRVARKVKTEKAETAATPARRRRVRRAA